MFAQRGSLGDGVRAGESWPSLPRSAKPWDPRGLEKGSVGPDWACGGNKKHQE